MGKCKGNLAWLEREDKNGIKVKSWAKFEKGGIWFCKLCNKTVSIGSIGFAALIQHSDTQQHKGHCRVLTSNQLRIRSPASKQPASSTSQDCPSSAGSNNSTASQLYSVKEETVRAELIWAMKVIQSNFSAASCDGLSEVFQAMFPTSSLENFTLGRTKFSYLVNEALGPYFRQIMLKDLGDSYFSLSFDETSNSADAKELQIKIIFWHPTEGKVKTHHLETFFLGHATATDVHQHIMMALENANLSPSKLLAVGSDGPNICKAVLNKIEEEVISLRGKGLLKIGTCCLHTVNNSFLKGLTELGEEISDLVLNLYYFFNGYASRLEDFERVQKEENVPMRKFIIHTSLRWLTLKPAIERLLQQIKAIQSYFIKFIPSKMQNSKRTMESSRYKAIVKAIKDPLLQAKALFVLDSASVFCSFTEKYQRAEPLIHVLHTDLKGLLLKIVGRVCKKGVFEECVEAETLPQSLFQDDNLLSLREVIIDEPIQIALENVREVDQLHFKRSVINHYVAAGKHLLKVSPVNNSFLRCLSFLHPKYVSSRSSLQNLLKVAQVLPIENVNTGSLQDEWRIVQLSQLKQEKNEQVDVYWQRLLHNSEESHFPHTSVIVKTCLSLPHGSAAVERGFSQSGRVMSDDRAAMSVRMLNNRLRVADGISAYGGKVHCIPISKELILKAQNARKLYFLHLEEEKRKKEKQEADARAKEEEKRLEEERLREISNKQESLSKLQGKLKELQEEKLSQTKVYDELVKEAQNRLAIATKKGDITGCKVAQSILQSAEEIKDKEKKKSEACEKLNNKVHKRVQSLLKFAYVSKKPKLDD